MRVADLCKFIAEREKVRERKEAGRPRPWTKDPIIGRYRFCNVHREDDAVTKWIAQNWRDPHAGLDDLWFMMVVARLLNQPESLEAVRNTVGVTWRPEKFRAILHARRDAGLRNFNAAYIVSTNGASMDKVDYLVMNVLGPLWAARRKLRPAVGEALASYHDRLMRYDGLGTFMAAQVVADMKYVEPLASASDWWTWAAKGPGSRRGLNRVYGREVDAVWGPEWLEWLQTLHAAVAKKLPNIRLHAQDLQNCLCEFDKYERARLGEGTPKQIYKEKAC